MLNVSLMSLLLTLNILTPTFSTLTFPCAMLKNGQIHFQNHMMIHRKILKAYLIVFRHYARKDQTHVSNYNIVLPFAYRFTPNP